MILFKYQGAQMFPGAKPGDVVPFQGILWDVTPQGHLEADVDDDVAAAADVPALIECNVVSEQVDAAVE